jgi:hypothetical protein
MNVSVSKNILHVTIGETNLKLLTSAVVNIGGGGVQWGDITGTLSNQTDLQGEINIKLDAADYNDRFKGLYASLFDLQAAHPTASAGDYAQVDLGIGTDVIVYAWDVNDAKWAAVGSSAIANTDALPEGSSNLYFTSQRVRDTAITGYTPTNSPIVATDTIVQAFGKSQGQINALAIGSEKTLLHRTLTKFYERKNSGSLSPFDINLRGLFETNYTIPANTLTAGDSFRIEFEIFIYLVAGQAGNYGISPMINGAIVPLSSEMLISISILATHQHFRGHIDFTCYSSGASGIFGFDGFAWGRNGAIYTYSQTPATYDTTQPITVNCSARFTATASGANTARVVFGRLYKISN